ncbi:hypothetical protein [Mycobacterium sp. shizuoka-1]|uniref:hypothetical protein n=1 Tax=Mycobacterium sp. shizuoka-1 TaxID=2039281 RepID=UPI000C067A34|nr:hypothetical protein [Mycobacterium sp. shizuoka-1]GAY14269.1 hypothetical protein MSZK_09950 [Mycobacterium sp. shizuoka-1]
MVSIDEEPTEASEWQWDDVVDVICAGAGPGALAHALYCTDLDLDVELADAEFPSAETDPDTAAYLQSMTDDLEPTPVRDLELAVVRAQPVTVSKDRRATIEPFFGSRLRDWSARCVASPFGVIYSQVPDAMTTLRTQSGETIRAAVLGDYRPETDRPGWEVAEWLREQAGDRGLLDQSGPTLTRLIVEYGRVAGAELATGEGSRLVRARMGVALSIGAVPDSAEWPVASAVPSGAAKVVMVSRTASRFGRVELLYES